MAQFKKEITFLQYLLLSGTVGEGGWREEGLPNGDWWQEIATKTPLCQITFAVQSGS